MTKKKQPQKSPIKSSYTENKYITYGLFIIFGVFVFIFSTYKISGDDDFFWHLATGRYIVENHSVPDTDIFGFVSAGNEWIPFEWGWDVLTYSLNSIGGYNLILIFRSLVFVLIFYIFYRLFNKFRVNPVLMFLIFAAFLFAIIDRLSPRPHILTYLFFALIIYLLTTFKYLPSGAGGDRQKYFKRLFILPVIFLIWANVHLGVMAGGLLLFVFVLSEVLTFYYPAKFSNSAAEIINKEHLKKLLLISFLCGIALLINPHFIHTYTYAYGHTKMKMLETVNEWRSPFDAMYGGGFVLGLFKVFLFGGLIILLYAYKKKDLFFALTYIVFVIYSVRAIRFTVDYEFIILFFFTVSLNYYLLKFEKNSIVNFITKHNSVKVILGVILIYIISMIPSGNLYTKLTYYRPYGLGIDDQFIPVQLFSFMKENRIEGKPFNQFGTGGYLVWNFPTQKNFLDSRNLNDELFNEYNTIMYMKPGFESKLDKYGIDYILYLDPDLIRRPKELQGVIVSYAEKKSNQWKLVFWDDKSFLYLKDVPKFKEVIDKSVCTILDPYLFIFNKNEFLRRVKSDPQKAKSELEMHLKSEPNGVLISAMRKEVENIIR